MRDNWQSGRLGNLCNIYQPKTISKKECVPDGDFPVFGANGIIGRYDKYNHEQPELLITCRGATCGAVNVSKPKSWINGNAMVVRPTTDNLSRDFLEYLFRGGIDLSTVITGSAQPQITRKSLSPVVIKFPPLPEQNRIVAILDEAFAGIATAVANTEKNLANARELFESHLNAVFTQKGDGWVEKKFGEIAGFSQGKQVGLQEQTKAPMAGYARFVRIVDYTQRTDDIRYVPDPGDKYHVTTDDIVMVRYGSPGLIGSGIAGVIANNLFKIAIIDRSVYEDYLSLFLMQKPIQQYLSTRGSVTMPALNFSHVRELVIKFPEISEQKKIVLLVDRYRIETQRLESIYQQKLDSLAELKQSILQKAFSGELTKAPDRALAEAGV